jgi:DNA-binding NarL/FixJ family response regulator
MTLVAIVDDKRSLCDALRDRLGRYPGLEVLFTAGNGKEFLALMREARQYREPDIVLMDIDMPVMNGIEAVAEGKLRYPKTKYLMLTIFDEDDKIMEAIKAGADGYLLKDGPADKIKEAIDHLMKEEGAPMSPGIARKVLRLLSTATMGAVAPAQPLAAHQRYKLTEREKDILTLLVEGLEYKEIAQKLGISPHTVRNIVTKIYGKLHVSSRMQAAHVVRGVGG